IIQSRSIVRHEIPRCSERSDKYPIRPKFVNGRSVFVRDIEVAVRSDNESLSIEAEPKALSVAVGRTQHWIDTIQAAWPANSVEGFSSWNSEGNRSYQIEVAGCAATGVNIERKFLHARCKSDGAPARSAMGQTVEHILESVVIDVRSKPAEAVHACTAS